MKYRRFKRTIAFIMALTLCTVQLAGCAEKDKSTSTTDSSSAPDSTSQTNESNTESDGGDTAAEVEPEARVMASNIAFSKSGSYTTTLSSEEVDLSGLTADNVEVRYANPYSDIMTADELITALSNEADASTLVNNDLVIDDKAAEASTEESFESLYPLTAKVASVSANSAGGYDISFTDEYADRFLTHEYMIVLKDANETAVASVDLPQIKITPDIEYVTTSDKEVKVTLTLNDSEFVDEVTEYDISLGDCFADMEIGSVSSSGKNLTVQLKGSPIVNDAGAYQWGTINVYPSAIKDAVDTVSANINIKLDNAYFANDTLTFEDGKVTANFNIYGGVDISTLTKDNVKIEGMTTELVESVDDTTVKLSFSADDVKSVNDFVELVGGKEITLGDYTTEITLTQASYYPVFDYVEEDGNNLKLTLVLYAFNGTFNSNLSTNAFSFGGGFDGAKAESITVDDDITATLIVSVPANGKTADDLEIDGTVTLAAGSMTNAWGDKTSKELSYTRDYSNESLGRNAGGAASGGVSLNTETLLEIQKYTRGLNSTFGKVCYYAGIAGQVFSIGKMVLEMTGAIQSEQDQLMEQFSFIDAKLDSVIDNQYRIMAMLDDISASMKEDANDRYRENLEDLKADIELQEDLFKLGAMYMALEDAVEAGKLDKMPKESEFDNYREYLPDESSMSDEELEAYNNRLIDYMIDRSLDPKDPVFDDFKTSYESLKTDLGHVADKLARTDATNPIIRYDTLCSLKYNFDSQCYNFRLTQRATASALLARGMMIVAAHEKIMTYPDEKTFKRLQARVEAAANWLDESYKTIGHPAEEIKAHPHYEQQTGSPVYISDIVVLGMSIKSSRSDAAMYLEENGYTLADGDCITNTPYKHGSTFYNGHNIYFGYKTTENYDEAIKDIILEQGTDADEHPSKSGYHLCNYLGDDAFLKMKGSLNENDDSDYYKLCIYYTKQNGSDNCAVCEWRGPEEYKLSFNLGSGDRTRMDFTMDQSKVSRDVTNVTKDVWVESDPEYYPYSYVLGKKVAYFTSDGYSDLSQIRGALCNRDAYERHSYGYFNWDDDTLKIFQQHMTFSSIKEEFADAGICDIPYGLITQIESETSQITQGRSRLDECKFTRTEGKIIEPNSTTPTDYHRNYNAWTGYDDNYIGTYEYYYNRETGDKDKNKSNIKHNFIALYLY